MATAGSELRPPGMTRAALKKKENRIELQNSRLPEVSGFPDPLCGRCFSADCFPTHRPPADDRCPWRVFCSLAAPFVSAQDLAAPTTPSASQGPLPAQNSAGIRGQVTNPSGAGIPEPPLLSSIRPARPQVKLGRLPVVCTQCQVFPRAPIPCGLPRPDLRSIAFPTSPSSADR